MTKEEYHIPSVVEIGGVLGTTFKSGPHGRCAPPCSSHANQNAHKVKPKLVPTPKPKKK